MQNTYYQATANAYSAFAPPQGRTEAQVAIVGGGYAGLATALGLAERGVKNIALLEAETIGYGASGRNGGFVFGGYSLYEQTLIDRLGEEKAKRIYGLTVAAVNVIRQRVQRHAIACDLVDQGVLWVNWFEDKHHIEERRRLLCDRYGVEWEAVNGERLKTMVASARYSGAAWEKNAVHLHPLNYAIGLAQAAHSLGAAIHERSAVKKLQMEGAGWRLEGDGFSLHAKQVVLACGGYLAGLDRKIDRAILPIATYVMATEPLGSVQAKIFPGTRAAIYDNRFAFDYYRPLNDTRLLWGGRVSIRQRTPEAVKHLLRRDMLKVFPELESVAIDYAWSGLMSYARHLMPQIRRMEQGLWCAQGFGGHGLATTTVAGELIADAIAAQGAGYRDFDAFGLASAFKPFGLLAAQAHYWWCQIRDAYRG